MAGATGPTLLARATELLVFGLGTAIGDCRVRQKNPTVTNVEPVPAMAESERGIEEAEQAKSKQTGDRGGRVGENEANDTPK